ncbi:MAG: polyprenol monophosphomannose synthase [Candidatus Woesearchaeota archaeon]
MKVCIVLPTYNEKYNLPLVLDGLRDVFKTISNFDMSVLVVDDNSPDKTYEIAAEYMKKHSFVKLLKREKKEGLGAAYIAGMKYAIEKLDADILFEMDADLSHDPKEIPNFLDNINAGYDFVIGSRYIKEGKVVGWSPIRIVVSKTGNLLSTAVAGIKNIKDCTSGYRAIRTDILKKIDLNQLKVGGYAFQISLLHKALNKNAKIVEMPITFIDRTHGDSKLSKKDILEFLINSFRLRFNK